MTTPESFDGSSRKPKKMNAAKKTPRNIHECLYIGGKVYNTSKCAIQVNKVGLKTTYPNTR